MKIIIALLFAVTSTVSFAQEKAKDPHPFVTEKTLDEKLTDKDRIIIVDVGAEWCGWCKKLEAESLPVAEKQYGDQLRIYHIDDTEGGARGWVQAHHVTYSLPGITLVRNGRVLSRSHGYREPEAFLNWIRDGLNGKGEFHTKEKNGEDDTEETKMILSKEQIEKLEK
ncbi:MAG: hypothetical protein JST80_12165 [Bdellovibrionales bacterium]|nr:hypothetical protein [Bdellovibrionales bacterium]